MNEQSRVIGIDPLVDFAFKLLLGSPEHARVTVHFLNAILGSEAHITEVTFQNPFLGKDHDGDKLSILDILAVDDAGQQFNIEVQTTLPAGLRQRLAYYDARLYVDQLFEGCDYRELKPAIVICVLSQPLLSRPAPLHSEFRLRDAAGLVLTHDLQVHLLELTKLSLKQENLSEATALEQWAWFLVNAPQLTPEEVRQSLAAPEFVEAAEILHMIEQTPEQLQQYRARMKLRLDDAARLEYAREQGEQIGEQRGLEKGRLEGREVGWRDGLYEGEIRGKLLGQIEVFQGFLGLETPTAEELAEFDLQQLTQLAHRMQEQLRDRP